MNKRLMQSLRPPEGLKKWTLSTCACGKPQNLWGMYLQMDFLFWLFTTHSFTNSTCDLFSNERSKLDPLPKVNHNLGGFQLVFVSISRVTNHMTCYNSSALIGGKFILKKEPFISPVWMLLFQAMRALD